MSAIEFCLPKVDSPLFHDAVEEVASLWEANPSASYEQAVFSYLVNRLMVSDDSWYDQVACAPSVSSCDAPCEAGEVPCVVPNVVSSEVVSFLKDSFPKTRVPDCRGHNTCSDTKCTFFHGPVCAFHAGQNTDNRQFLFVKQGNKEIRKPNPNWKKPMLCGRGDKCDFDHASATLRASREEAILQQNRFRFAPPLSTEADLIAFGLEWRFADVYTYGHLAAEKMDLLEVCLDRSGLPVLPLEGGFSVATNDFEDARFMPDMEVKVPVAPLPEGFTVVSRQSRSDKGRR
jgi:hypothetical protein